MLDQFQKGPHLPFRLIALLSILLAATIAARPSHAQTKTPNSPHIHGFAKQGTIPLSGVHVTILSADARKKFAAITDGSGAYSITLPADGRYSIRADFRAITTSPQQIAISPTRRDLAINFSFEGAAVATSLSSLWPPLILAPVAVNTISLQPNVANPGGTSGAQFPQFTGDPIFSGDTFTVSGQPTIITPYFQMADQMRADFEDGHELQGPPMKPYATFTNPPPWAKSTQSNPCANSPSWPASASKFL